jgi:hypothetical protein
MKWRYAAKGLKATANIVSQLFATFRVDPCAATLNAEGATLR